MDTVHSFSNLFTKWVINQISQVPENINILYFEFNVINGEFYCSIFGYNLSDAQGFDPEVIDSLEMLGKWEWESHSLQVNIVEDIILEIEEGLLNTILLKLKEIQLLHAKKELLVLLGRHDGTPKRVEYNSFQLIPSVTAKVCYIHELHFDYSSNDLIEKYEADELIEDKLLDYEKIAETSNIQLKLWIRKSKKYKDLLYFYRGWLICSTRLADIFNSATSELQLLPIKLYQSPTNKEIFDPVYVVANLFEKIDCIDKKWLTRKSPIKSPGTDGLTFDPGHGYKVLSSKIVGKNIFRVSRDDYRLLVSQQLRDEIEKQGITGISWIKRECE